MGVPFEALLPYGIMVAMFGVSGAGLSVIKFYSNGGKRTRYNVDKWDKQSDYARTLLFEACLYCTVMERDRRLTGKLRGQTDKPYAPAGFELNTPWKLEGRII